MKPDPITLDAAVYLMLCGIKIAWAPFAPDDPDPWDFDTCCASSEEVRTRAMRKGWVYAKPS